MNHYWVDKDRALQRANLNEDSQGQGTGTSVLRTGYLPTLPDLVWTVISHIRVEHLIRVNHLLICFHA